MKPVDQLVAILATPYKDPLKKTADILGIIHKQDTEQKRVELMEWWLALATLPAVPGTLEVEEKHILDEMAAQSAIDRLSEKKADISCRFLRTQPGKSRRKARKVARTLLRKLKFIRSAAGEDAMVVWFLRIVANSSHIPYIDPPEDLTLELELVHPGETDRILRDNYEEFAKFAALVAHKNDCVDFSKAICIIAQTARNGNTALAQALGDYFVTAIKIAMRADFGIINEHRGTPLMPHQTIH